MKYINKFKLTTEFEAVKEQLQELEHYLVYDAEKDMIYLKMLTDKSYTLNYKITQDLIEIGLSIGGKLPLITRCDLFKSIKVDDVDQDLSGKIRTPYEFKGEANDELLQELQTELIFVQDEEGDPNVFNEEYVLTTSDLTEDKEGIIEVIWQDNIPLKSLFGCMFYNLCITNIQSNIFINKQFTNLSGMFFACFSLTSLDLSSFDISKVTEMYEMFKGCDVLSHIKCKQAFKDWCIEHQSTIELPTAMREGGNGQWDVNS